MTFDNTTNVFSFSRQINAAAGFSTTGLTIDDNSSIAISGFNDIEAKSLSLQDDNSGKVTIDAPSTVSSNYTLKLPSAQGAANTFLSNDGSGNLSFTTPPTPSTSWNYFANVRLS